MTSHTARRLAWGLAITALLLAFSGVAAFAATGNLEIGFDIFPMALAVAFSIVGALIASRHPGNVIGWIFLGVGVATGLGNAAHGYAQYWVDGNGGPEALGEAAAVFANASWVPFVLVPATFLLMLFPDGRLLSPRWRWIAWGSGVAIAGALLTEMVTPGPVADYPQVQNPVGVESTLLEAFEAITYLLLLVGVGGSCLALILRFRRAPREQRQQIKWLAFAGAVAAVTIPIGIAGYDLWGETVANIAIMLSVLGVPVAAGIAILKHRLYDIDVVVNRTLVYGSLTAVLTGTYVGLVLAFRFGLSPVTGDSGVAIVASTLAVAALFRPVRGRIQHGVDRRFYRNRYDAARTLERFGARLRDEVDLDALAAELRAVVADTMQPTHVSLWLRSPEGRNE